jgi:lysophospholipase L1-like esterase
MRIVCIGDSLTYGYRVNERERWTYLFSKDTGIELINKGVLGDSTSGMIMRFYSEVININPTAAFIMGGSNDFLMNRSLDSVKNNIKHLVKEAKQFNLKILLGIQPPTIPHLAERLWASNVNYEEINRKISDYADWMKSYSHEQGFLYIDFFNGFINNIPNSNLEDYYIDGLHLNSEGHKAMCKIAVDSFTYFYT